MNWLTESGPSTSLSGSFSTQLAVLLFAAILGGGLFTGLGNFIKARTSSKQVRLDTDPNSPRVAIGGAETAVTLMGRALESLQTENGRQAKRIEEQASRIDELEASVKSRDDHIEKQDKEIDELKESVRVLNARLGITT